MVNFAWVLGGEFEKTTKKVVNEVNGVTKKFTVRDKTIKSSNIYIEIKHVFLEKVVKILIFAGF